MSEYNFKELEKYWKEKWESEKLYQTFDDTIKKKFYVLDMFPYPSGDGLHVGHARIYTASDIFARTKRMQGYNVLHPTGWDAFGLPAEQFAIKNKIHPRISTDKNIATFRRQMKDLALSYDFEREVDTTDPEFYKWTQWIFLKMYEKGLAFQSYEPINWCPSCQTGLANEDLDGDKCERCHSIVEKKPMRQWVLSITKYADRLLDDLNTLNEWPEWLKILQRNWIGKSEGAEFDFKLEGTENFSADKVKIFTTRADTLFGATFVAVSAELADSWVKNGWQASEEIKNYISKTLEEQKQANDYSKEIEKTGIETGIFAINPANGEKIPVWIANYILGGVGTGAIMAVPAHDERDFDFAKKYNLPIRDVISKKMIGEGENQEKDGVETLIRKTVDPIIRDNEGNFYFIKENENHIHFAGGGVDEGEDDLTALAREIKEETGFVDFKIGKKIMPQISYWGYRHTKNKNQRTVGPAYEVILNSDKRIHSEVEDGRHELIKVKKEDVLKTMTWKNHRFIFERYLENSDVYTEEGVLINSNQYDGLTSEEAKEKIIADCGGKKTIRYKLQDWVFSRQRYWGEPMPIVHDEKGKDYPLDESELPLVLPEVENYAPSGTGESPLANISDWVNVKGCITDKGTFKQSADGKIFKRETNTMPQWAGSSWYYLRFADPKNKNELISKELEKYWNPVDVYVGGAEHATRHLIYARFYHKFLYDIGAVSHSEPFMRIESVGLVLGEDGTKMSKRLGNVINPDDVLKEWGVDVMRVYIAFMGSFYDATPWNPKAIVGCKRFLEKVLKCADYIQDEEVKEIVIPLNQTIKKITEDFEVFKFNTAVSQMMIFINKVEEVKKIGKNQMKDFVKLLAPIAVIASEELWKKLGEEKSVHISDWPKYDEKFIEENEVTIAIQVNGKLRGTVNAPLNISQNEIIELVKKTKEYEKNVGDATPKKIIFVPNKLINIVI